MGGKQKRVKTGMADHDQTTSADPNDPGDPRAFMDALLNVGADHLVGFNRAAASGFAQRVVG
jgi:hypothetical protein